MGAAENLERVREKVRDGIERFDRAFGTAGQIDNDGFVADNSDAAGKHGGRRFLNAFAANFFGDAGDSSVGDVDCGFRSGVARAETGATCSE